MKDRQPSRVPPGVLISALALLALVLVGCNLNVSATTTPAFSVGSTVFSVVRWADPSRAIDVVFVADEGYGDLSNVTNRQNFLNDVADLIDSGFWQNNMVVSNLGLFNFWFSTEAGGDVEPPASGICPSVTWPSLTDAAFAEMAVIVHRENVRDCGGGGRASAKAGGGREWIVVHESGHAAFGLPDEYCCDGGNWHIPPILYNSQASCTGDAANAAWRDCRSFTSNSGTWWRSEDNNIDLMRDAGPTVWEIGPADWVIVSQVLGALPGASPNTPSVFAPTNWDWP
ncbi:MAG: hypothetical protein Kow0077_14050 [Anaerolineae bacterium]